MRFGLVANSLFAFAKLGHRHHVEQFLEAFHPTNLLDSRQQRIGPIKATEGLDRLGHGLDVSDGQRGTGLARVARLLPRPVLGLFFAATLFRTRDRIWGTFWHGCLSPRHCIQDIAFGRVSFSSPFEILLRFGD